VASPVPVVVAPHLMSAVRLGGRAAVLKDENDLARRRD